MKNFQGTALETSVKQMQADSPILRLVEITVPTATPSVLRLVNYDRDIQYGNDSAGLPLTWKRFPIAMGELRDNRKGDLSQLVVNVCNVTAELMAWIDGYNGLVGESLTISSVQASSLTDPAIPMFHGDVISCEVDSNVAVFTVGQTNLMTQIFPARRCLTQCSVVRFGDDDCGYVIPPSPTNAVGGGFDSCGRSLEECRLRGDDEEARGLTRKHPKRFDGMPGVAAGNT